MPEGSDITIAPAELEGHVANDTITVPSEYGALSFTLPDEYRPGDYVKCRVLAPKVNTFYTPAVATKQKKPSLASTTTTPKPKLDDDDASSGVKWKAA